jgi:ABC-type proline/glycine betaine transport system substrate-binding protein
MANNKKKVTKRKQVRKVDPDTGDVTFVTEIVTEYITDTGYSDTFGSSCDTSGSYDSTSSCGSGE